MSRIGKETIDSLWIETDGRISFTSGTVCEGMPKFLRARDGKGLWPCVTEKGELGINL